LIDPILVSGLIKFISSSVISTDARVSDHLATLAVLEIPHNVEKTYKKDIWI